MDISNILSMLSSLVTNNQNTAPNTASEPTNTTEQNAPLGQQSKPQYEVRNASFPPPFEEKTVNIHNQTVNTNSNYMKDLYPPNPDFVDLKQPTYNAPSSNNPLNKLLGGLGGGDIDLMGLIQKFLPLLQNLGGSGGGGTGGLLGSLGGLFGKKNTSTDNKKSTTDYSSAVNNTDAEIIIDDLIRVDSN